MIVTLWTNIMLFVHMCPSDLCVMLDVHAKSEICPIPDICAISDIVCHVGYCILGVTCDENVAGTLIASASLTSARPSTMLYQHPGQVCL